MRNHTAAFFSNSVLIYASACLVLTSCHLPQLRQRDDLDPVPTWYNQAFRSSVDSIFDAPGTLYDRKGFTSSSIRELRLLAWQDYSMERPLIDSSHVLSQGMVWIHLVTPGTERESWAVARIWGRPEKWMLTQTSHVPNIIVVYDHPPTTEEIYAENIWSYFFESSSPRPVYDGYLRVNTWQEVTGEKPTHPFDVRRPGHDPMR